MRLFRISLLVSLLGGFLISPENIFAQQEQRKSTDVYVVGNGVKAPVVLHQPLPAYTEEARAAGVEGILLVQAIIRVDGTVDSIKILRGLGYGLDESAITTIATKWRFAPGSFNGVPVNVQANIEVSFRLFKGPAEMASLKPYTLRVHMVDTNWDRDPSANVAVSGHGNLLSAGSVFGLIYDSSCRQGFGPGSYPARWIQPESRLEIALGFKAGTGMQKVCEANVRMQNVVYTLRDGQVVTIDPRMK